jgi:hypothetical protein
MIESAAPRLTGGDAAALAEIRAGLEQIKQGFASPDASARPALDQKGFYAAVSRVEQAAGKLMTGRQI